MLKNERRVCADNDDDVRFVDNLRTIGNSEEQTSGTAIDNVTVHVLIKESGRDARLC